MNEYYVYILSNSVNNKTYVGVTNNLGRRIRQHNSIICGGARYTKSNNCIWNYHTIIENLNKHNALSIEKKIKIYSRKFKGTPIDKRLNALKYLKLII
jgi:predicted GIY-YIG superfamily endonuclease